MKRLLFMLLIGLNGLAANSSAQSAQPIPAPQISAPTPGFAIRTAANFDDLRHTMKELIGTSKKRVWVLTDYLSDGTIANAIFLAKYRKLDVKVFFGKEKLGLPPSRVSYLKSQGVPVFVRPKHGFNAPTLIFADQRLYSVNTDLNGAQLFGSFSIVQQSPEEVKSFVIWLREVMNDPVVAIPKLVPGIRRFGKEPFQGDSEGSYNYDRAGYKKAPEGVSKELPRVPKWKRTQEQRTKEAVPEAALTVPADPAAPVIIEPEAAGPEGSVPEIAPPLAPPRPWINPEPVAPEAATVPSDEDRPSGPLMEE